MTTIVQAHAAEDLLALVPQLVGCTPTSSLVLVLFAGRSSSGALRISLPRGTKIAEAGVEAVAQRVLGFACRAPGVDAVVPVLYTDEPFGARTDGDGVVEPPGRAIVQAVIALARQHGFVVKDALCSATDGWASYFDPDIPAGGRSLSIVDSSPLADVVAVPDELVTAALPEVEPAERRAVELALDEMSTQLAALLESARAELPCAPGSVQVVEHLDDMPEFFEVALRNGPDGMTPERHALLLLAVSRAWASDVALMQWAFGPELGQELADAEHDQGHRCLGDGDAEVFHRVARLLVGDGPRPHLERVHAAIALMRAVAARAPESHRHAPLCMLAWFSWALGQSTRALAFLDQLPAASHDDGLAPTIRAMVDQGHLPDWVFAAVSVDRSRGAALPGHPAA